MSEKLLIIVPTRSRPHNVAKVIRAWEETGAFNDGAELCFAVDADDPELYAYATQISLHRKLGFPIKRTTSARWRPMVHKLNETATMYACQRSEYFAIGFAGDDHLPRTEGWAFCYRAALDKGTAIVSCPDGYRKDDLPTQWAMTADIVRALGRMVPAAVEHLYCDDSIRDLGKLAGCYRWLPDVLIEHMHPLAGKSPDDLQYESVNGRAQYVRDRAAYKYWKLGSGSAMDYRTVRNLIEEKK